MNASQQFVPSIAGGAAVSLQGLLDQATQAAAAVTFACVPPGHGTRIGIDRNTNNVPDPSE